MKTAEQYLGRFFLDRSGDAPRLLEVRDHLEGVYLVYDGESSSLICARTLAENIGDVFSSRERAERAFRQLTTAMASRRAWPTDPLPEVEAPAIVEPEPFYPIEPPTEASQASALQDDHAYVEAVSAVIALPEADARAFHAIVEDVAYLPHTFLHGALAGSTVSSINLVDARTACGLEYPDLVALLMRLRDQSLLEVVTDTPAPDSRDFSSYWIVVNPDCVEALASTVTPFGKVA